MSSGMWPVLIAFLLGCGVGLCIGQARAQDCEFGAYGCGHMENHEKYKDWNERPIYNNGLPTAKGNCCNGEDCRPVRADQDFNGLWRIWIPEQRRWLDVPPEAVGTTDRFHDGRNHACTSKVFPDPEIRIFIYCFSPTTAKY